jgi:hypothetical protein
MAKKQRRASAEYFASLCDELATLAERNGFHTGSYLLKMACLEFTDRQDCSETVIPEKMAC